MYILAILAACVKLFVLNKKHPLFLWSVFGAEGQDRTADTMIFQLLPLSFLKVWTISFPLR